MIITTTPDNKVEMSGVTVTSEFRIKNSAKAFGILSSGLYANKIRAIIRELSCNALDSHVAAGCADKPFDMHLPTQLAPWFALRDYGVGLDHDEVVNLYTTYFASTKTQSNDFIGALGLGSKSPFSYTENFTITAIKNGMKRIYSAYINEQGVPAVALLGEHETHDPNGVELRFSVIEHDFYKFKDEAENILRRFAVLPNQIGAKLDVKQIEYSSEICEGVKIRKSGFTTYNRNYAIMGNIAYPIDIPNSSSVLGNLHLLAVDRASLDIEFPMGSLEFQASREGLSYNKQTIEAIVARYQGIADSIAKSLEAKINQTAGAWERAFLFQDLRYQEIWEPAIKSYLQQNDVPFISSSPRIIPSELVSNYNISLAVMNSSKNYLGEYPCTVRVSKSHDNMVMACSRKTRFIINEKNERITEKVKHTFRNTASEHTVYVISPADKTKPMLVQEFLQQYHNPPTELFVGTSLLVAKVREKKADTISLMRFDYNKWAECKNFVQNDNETYFYVEMHGNKVITPDGNTTNLRDIFESFKRATGSTPVIYGVRKSGMKDITALPNWVPFFSLIRDKLLAYKKEDFYAAAIGSCLADNVFRSEIVSALPATSRFVQFAKNIKATSTNGTYYMSELSTKLNLGVNFDQMMRDAETDIKTFIDDYPMLRYTYFGHIRQSLRGPAVNDVIAYINQIENINI